MFVRDRRWFSGFGLLVCLILVGGVWMLARDGTNSRVPQQQVAPADPDTADQSSKHIAPTLGDPQTEKEPAISQALLRGRVIDASTKQPVREFQLEFWTNPTLRPADQLPKPQTFRTAEGTFEASLPEGRWTVFASAPGYQSFELPHVQLTSAKAAPEVIMPLRRGHTVEGRVYDESSGIGIAGARIAFREAQTVRFDDHRRSRVPFQTQPDGSFVLDGVPLGRVTVTATAPGYAEREIDTVVADAMSPLEIGLSAGGTIAGRLTEADGVTPILGMSELFGIERQFGVANQTNGSGEFSYQHLPAGRYRLRGEADGMSVSREITLAKNEKLENIVLALGSGSSIRGIVTGLSPTDLERVRISMYRPGDTLAPGGSAAKVDARGEFVVRGVAPGRVRLTASVPERHVHKTVVVPAGVDAAVELHFPRGANLSGRITRDGKPLANAYVQGLPLGTQDITLNGTPSSPDGRYLLRGLPTGEYVVSVDGYRSRPLQITEDTEFDIDVPNGQVAGRFLEESGNVPVVDVQVTLWPAQPEARSPRLHAGSDHYGKFIFMGLEQGHYTLVAYKPGYAMHREQISYDAPISDVTVRLYRDEGVQIKVRDARRGDPLHAVVVSELIGEFWAASLQIRSNKGGIGYLPRALIGSTLQFWTPSYSLVRVDAWNGEGLDLQMVREE